MNSLNSIDLIDSPQGGEMNNLASGYDIVFECLGCGKIRKSRSAAENCAKTKYCGEEAVEKMFRCRQCGQDHELIGDVRQCDHEIEKEAK